MIIALILSVAGVVLSALGMRCTTVMNEESKAKRWVVIAGGICHLTTGKAKQKYGILSIRDGTKIFVKGGRFCTGFSGM